MIDNLDWQYAGIAGLATFKFLVSSLWALWKGLSFWELLLFNFIPAMLGVLVSVQFGLSLRIWYFKRFPKKISDSSKNRSQLIDRIWNKFGFKGCIALAPFISPPLAAMVSILRQEGKPKVIASLALSLFLWTVIFSGAKGFMLEHFSDWIPENLKTDVG